MPFDKQASDTHQNESNFINMNQTQSQRVHLKSKFICRNFLYINLILLISCVIIWFTGCPIKKVTGLSCAGCGLTRAWVSFLKLDLKQAFYFHPLFWSVPIMYILILLNDTLSSRKKYYIWGGIITLFLIVYFIRLFGDSSIVNFSYTETIIYKLFYNRRS